MVKSNNPTPQVIQTQSIRPAEKTTWNKLFDFFEHTWVVTVLGAVGVGVGLVYTPVLAVFGGAILLAFHRVGVVRGTRLLVQFAAYSVVFLITTLGLYWVESFIKKNIDRQPRINPIPQAEKPKEQLGPPFAFAVEVRIVSPGFAWFTGFWLKYNDQKGCSLAPIDDLLFFRVTNVQSMPKTVINYTVELKNKGEWHPLKRVNLASGYLILTLKSNVAPHRTGGTLNFPSKGDDAAYPLMSITADQVNYKEASIINFPIFDALIGGQTLTEGQTIRGWAGFQSPIIAEGEIQIKITDEIGKTYSIMPTITRSGTDEDVAPHLITIAAFADVSGCARKSSFYDQPPEISPSL